MLGPGADAGPAGHRPAPQGPEERPDRATPAHDAQPPEPDDQAALVPRHGRHAPPQFPQPRRPCAGRQRHALAVGLDQRAVRPAAVLGRHRLGQGAMGRQADPEGHHGRGGRAAGRQGRGRRTRRQQPRRPSARRCAQQHSRLAGHCGRGRHADRGLDGRRHPLRPGRAQGLGPGRARHDDRPRDGLWPGGDGRGRRHQGPADPAQGARRDDGLLRPPAADRRHARHSGAGQLPAGLIPATAGVGPDSA
mmetsp:Transcript_59440/g.140575  ORF Transcript_59440/g.140575 Transcript_59440/m.140575 type:complete len:249 (+) Transcript_59440:519-1265(+)